jgi:hypothetical protein
VKRQKITRILEIAFAIQVGRVFESLWPEGLYPALVAGALFLVVAVITDVWAEL